MREGYLLERRRADGQPDPQYGERGSTTFTLGPDNEGPAALRADALGRAWVVGTSRIAEGQRAVVLRFGAAGRPDAAFAANGRAVIAPAGREARATDILPLDDGAAWVTGVVIDAQGGERAAVWRLRPDGTVDLRFGLGGLWSDAMAGETDAGGLLRSPDGEVALGLRRSDGPNATLEVWAWRGEAAPRRVQAQTVPAERLDAARLSWRGDRWSWDGGPMPAAPVPSDPAASAPAESGAAIATPFTAKAPPPSKPEEGTAWPVAGGWWLMLTTAIAAALWWWRHVRREGRR